MPILIAIEPSTRDDAEAVNVVVARSQKPHQRLMQNLWWVGQTDGDELDEWRDRVRDALKPRHAVPTVLIFWCNRHTWSGCGPGHLLEFLRITH